MEAGLRNLSSQLLISRSLAPRHITLTSLSSSSPYTIFIMFARVATVATLFALPILAAAGSCNTGDVQCCNSLEEVSFRLFKDVNGVLTVGNTVQLCGGRGDPVCYWR